MYPACSFLDSETLSVCGSLGNSLKNKHPVSESDTDTELQEVKRLKFSEEEEDEEQEVDTPIQASCLTKEAETMSQAAPEEDEKSRCSKDSEASSTAAMTEELGEDSWGQCASFDWICDIFQDVLQSVCPLVKL